jgi:GTP cyclohydrolase I
MNLHEQMAAVADAATDPGMKRVFDENTVTQLLTEVIGVEMREGLVETPARVVKAWREWTAGYGVDVPALLKVFEDGAEGADQMVIVHNIPFYSKCEHHLADIIGHATVAYIPNGKIVGLSKLPRVVEAFARRLQVQERLTNQIADAIADNLGALGVGVIITARHMCMESRGINRPGTSTTTSALRGCIKNDPTCRSEFMQLALAQTK